MSCVDAAIIKALVEHIGMDPEDVPVGGTTQSHATDELLDISFGTTEQDGNEYITITKPNSVLIGVLRPGDMIVVESKESGTRYYHICVQAFQYMNLVRFIHSEYGAERAYTEAIDDKSTIITPIEANLYRPVGVYRINSLESIVRAAKMFFAFAASKHPLEQT